MSKRVWLDAGHGGTSPGACGGDIRESDVALSVTLKVGEILSKKGIGVLYTRTDDTSVSLSKRSHEANQAKVDAFISIHCNSASNTNARGVETFCYKFKYRPLADAIQKQLTADPYLYKYDRGVKEGDFHVIRETNMDAALVELAFISNGEDRWLLKNKQDGFAKAIANGIMNFLGVLTDETVKEEKPSDIIINDENSNDVVEGIDDTPVYHVVVGEVLSKEKAEAIAKTLKEQGYGNVMISVTTNVK